MGFLGPAKRKNHRWYGLTRFFKIQLALMSLIVFSCHLMAYAQPTESGGDAPSAPPMLRAGVSKSLYLPDDMYGYWSVTGTLLETNAPGSFNQILHDIWVLEEVGDEVRISNPVTGASASVNVEKVEGNTATFHRTFVSRGGRVFFEMPTVTVFGDILNGSTINQFRFLKNGKVSQSYYAKYRLDARRIGGEKIRFQQHRAEPRIQIDEIQNPPDR